MIDIILRDCGHGEWLPVITSTASRKVLYRGNRVRSQEEALAKANAAWDESATGNIVKFKELKGL